MKYLSLDLETTCLQASPEHILQVSMVVEDTTSKVSETELPHFTCFVAQPKIQGEAYALGMNGWILDIISGRAKNTTGYPILPWKSAEQLRETGFLGTWLEVALGFLDVHFGATKITVAGKNVAGFDIPFLPKELRSRFRHKVLDPGPLLVNWVEDDQVPNFELCKKRAGLEAHVAHDAREDAMDVIRCLRMFY